MEETSQDRASPTIRQSPQADFGRMACITLMAVLLSACGVRMTAQRVDNVNQDIAGEGIVYALPKTEFEVVQRAKLTLSKSGALLSIHDSCRRACTASKNGKLDDGDESCSFDTEPQIALAAPTLRSVPVPDRKRLYRVTPEAELFRSLDIKFDVASSGVIEQADVASENLAYEVIASAAGAVLQVTGAASPFTMRRMSSVQVSAGRSCYAVSNEVSALVKKGAGELSCQLMDEIEACMKSFDDAVASERDALNKLFDRAESKNWTSRFLLALAENRRDRIVTAVARRDEAAGLYGLSEAADKVGSFEIVIPHSGPAEFTDHYSERALNTVIASGVARVSSTSDDAAPLLGLLMKSLASDTRVYRLKVQPPSDIGPASTDAKSNAGDGFHYRIPVSGTTTLEVLASGAKDATLIFGPVVEQRLVAQYGPIAALPSRFKGKGGRLLVKHWPDSGGLQHVEIGAQPLPTDTVTGLLDTAVAQHSARKSAREAAAAAEASKDPELEDLTRQLEILQLRRDIRDVEEELDAEDSP